MSRGDDYQRRIAQGTLFNALGAVVGQLAELATVAVLVNRLGPSAFGVVVLGQAWSQMAFILESGIGQQVVRSVAARRGLEGDDLSSVIAIYLAVGLIALLIGIGISHSALRPVLSLHGDGARTASVAFDLIVIAGAVRLTTGFVPRALLGSLELGALRICGLVRSVVLLLATGWLVDPGAHGLVAAGQAVLLAEVIAAVLGLILVVPRLVTPRLSLVTRSSVLAHMREARAMTASGGIGLVSTRIDPVVVAVALGSAATATYGVALRAYDVLRSATELISLAMMPATARLLALDDTAGVGLLYRRSLRLIAGIVWPCAIAAVIFSTELLDAWIGAALPGGARAFTAAMVLSIVVGPGALAFYVVTGAHQVRDVLRRQAIAALVGFAIEVALIRAVGVAAVFVGSSAGAVIVAARYLEVVAVLTGSARGALLRAALRPGACAAAAAVGLVVIRSTGVHGASLIAWVGLVAVAHLATTLVWALPKDDLLQFVGRARRPVVS